MRGLYEEYLDWLAEEIQDEYYAFKERFLELEENNCTDDELEEFMEKLEKHDLVVITKLCWERCKEGAKYDY